MFSARRLIIKPNGLLDARGRLRVSFLSGARWRLLVGPVRTLWEKRFRLRFAFEDHVCGKSFEEGTEQRVVDEAAITDLMERMVVESEESIDWAEAQLDLIRMAGLENYLAQKIGEDEKEQHRCRPAPPEVAQSREGGQSRHRSGAVRVPRRQL